MKILLYILLLLPLPCVYAVAQDEPGPEGKGRERLEQLRRVKLIDALDLNEEQALRLSVREKEFRESERALMDKRKAAIQDLEKLIADKADDTVLKEQLSRLEELNTRIVRDKHGFLLSLTDFLSMQQVAKIVVFEQHFSSEVRRLLQKAHRPPRR